MACYGDNFTFFLRFNHNSTIFVFVLFQQCAAPITWTGYKGKEVTMETVHIQRAKELKELYCIMCQDNITTKERIELLISLKYAVCTKRLC
jgi:hypothetical protein